MTHKTNSSSVGLDDSYSKQILGLYFSYCHGYKIRVDTGEKRRKRNKSTKTVNPLRKEGGGETGRKRQGGWGRKQGHFNTQLNQGKQNNKNPSSSREIVLIRSPRDKVTQRKKNARNCYNLCLREAT